MRLDEPIAGGHSLAMPDPMPPVCRQCQRPYSPSEIRLAGSPCVRCRVEAFRNRSAGEKVRVTLANRAHALRQRRYRVRCYSKQGREKSSGPRHYGGGAETWHRQLRPTSEVDIKRLGPLPAGEFNGRRFEAKKLTQQKPGRYCACGRSLELGRFKTRPDVTTCRKCRDAEEARAKAERQRLAEHGYASEADRQAQFETTMSQEEWDRMIDGEDE